MRAVLPLLVGLSGCALVELLEEPPPPNCAPRVAFYPDEDGDGLGERTSVYVGCLAPDGWVTELEPLDTDTGSPADTDTGSPADTDTDLPTDTDGADTDASG